MKRTRKWAFVAQEATRLAALDLAPAEIAKRLGVNKSSVTRWMKAGKLARTAATVTIRAEVPPAQWAKVIRESYDLDATDEQLVMMAEHALLMSTDLHVAAHVRLSAAGRFQALVRQLALVAHSAEPEKEQPVAPASPAVVGRVVRPRPSVDPRRVLMMAIK